MSVTVCREPGCPNLWPCAMHPERAKDARPSAAARGYDYKWRRTRGRYLQLHPTCEYAGCHVPAVDVHHRDLRGPLGPNGHRHSNLQALCKSHHAQITGRTTGLGRRSAA